VFHIDVDARLRPSTFVDARDGRRRARREDRTPRSKPPRSETLLFVIGRTDKDKPSQDRTPPRLNTPLGRNPPQVTDEGAVRSTSLFFYTYQILCTNITEGVGVFIYIFTMNYLVDYCYEGINENVCRVEVSLFIFICIFYLL